MERALTVLLATGVILGEIARALFWIAVTILAAVGVCLLILFGMSAAGREAEWSTRPR